MAANNVLTQLHLFIKPVREYLIHGPIEPSSLAYLEFLQIYMEMGLIDDILDIHFMLEKVIIDGAPRWWKGTVAHFEEKFHEQYQRRIQRLNEDSDFIWMAAYKEVEEKRLPPLSEDPEKDQIENFLSQGRKRLRQTFAVELLMDMWCEVRNV